MNTLILYAMGLASLVVIIAGVFFLVIMIVYYIQVVWSKISACAKNTMEYLQNKQDFEVYKTDVLRWDMAVKDLNEFLSMDELCPIQCEWCKWNDTFCDGKTPEWRGIKED